MKIMSIKQFHQIMLFLILVTGIVVFVYANGNSGMQMWTGIITSASYVAWGLIYHALNEDLHAKVVVEYLLIGAIAVIILLTLF